MPYAEGTDVSPARSREEIERLLLRYGATSFVSGFEGNVAAIMFEVKQRRVRFQIVMPTDPNAREFAHTATGRPRQQSVRQQNLEAEIRRRWRALTLVIKAKLEAVQSGIVTFEQEFGMHFVLPGGGTVAEQILPAIDAAYRDGQPFRPMLTAGGG